MNENYFGSLLSDVWLNVSFSHCDGYHFIDNGLVELSEKYGLTEKTINLVAYELYTTWLAGFDEGYDG